MAYNTKLRLIDAKMEQPSGTTLTLSGETTVASGGTIQYKVNQHGLYDDRSLVDKEYVDNAVTGGTEIFVFDDNITVQLNDPNATFGKYKHNMVIPASGQTPNWVIIDAVTEGLEPDVTEQSLTSFSFDSNTTREIGSDQTINFSATFNRGLIDPYYDENGDEDGTRPRSGLPNQYNYTGPGIPSTQASTDLSDVQAATNHVVTEGNTSWTASVNFDAGTDPVRNSFGEEIESTLGAGTSNTRTLTINGIYPFFYGISATQPTIDQALLNSHDIKSVSSSSGNITLEFSGSPGYLWFAVPASAPIKQSWFDPNNPSNVGTFGANSLFAAGVVEVVDSPDGFWSGIGYRFYVTNFATSPITIVATNNPL